MTDEEHRQRHVALHQALDELLADWIAHTPGPPYLDQPIHHLLAWSFAQTKDPTPLPGAHPDPAP